MNDLVERLATAVLPRDWKAEPPPASTKQLGDAWVRESRSAILVAPSVIIPDEVNYILNPAHADFRKITTGNPQEFSFDPRLF